MSSPRIAIVISSMYGHISSVKMAEAAKQSVEKAGGQASIFQIAETLSPGILTKLHAPPKPHYPIITPNDLTYDGGVPTRYGNMPAQWKTLESVRETGKMLFKTFSCFFMLVQLFRMIMKSKKGVKKLSHSLDKLLQLLARWHSAFEATIK
ncbi:benzoquinone reductase [Amanita muscaria Koide BX008]|uniref:Benzoquinone reductase n=1 Tax=Amanita muscaria (strain Koide BX008) TaxID=946122 RepID=A0A0C2SCK4_AMAMK|nr:benzoquinone reductase [Amanita muscaria Koide BX008]